MILSSRAWAALLFSPATFAAPVSENPALVQPSTGAPTGLSIAIARAWLAVAWEPRAVVGASPLVAHLSPRVAALNSRLMEAGLSG